MMFGLILSRFVFKKKPSLSKLVKHTFSPGERIIPAGTSSPVYNGFVGSQSNSDGLKIEFYHDLQSGVCCQWLPEKRFEGYPGILHGGISFAILDELAAYAVFKEFDTYSVTVCSKTHWLGRIRVGKTVYGKAVVTRKFWRFIQVKACIFNAKGRPTVEITNIFYIPTKKEFERLIDKSVMPEESLPYCGLK